MSRLEKDWETLNAYVDGELSPNDAAAVARGIAQDPGAAETAATLSSLKSALLEQAEPPSDFELLPSATAGKKPTVWQAAHTAAAAAVLVICMAVGAVWHWGATRDDAANHQMTAWHQEAADIHQDWVASRTNERPPALNIPATAALTAPQIRIPDLSDSGLTPILLEAEAHLGSMTGYRVGYGGTRGCRISFFVLQGDDEIPTQLAVREDGGPRALAWRHDQTRYLLLANGMAEARFDLIARTLQSVTTDWRPLSAETRTALQQNRQTSAPCTA